MSKKTPTLHLKLGAIGVSLVAALIVLPFVFEKVSPGHEAVGVLFGDVDDSVLESGLHFPVNPLKSFDHFSNLERTAKFNEVRVPAADQQTATMDISVQFSIAPGAAILLRSSTGDQRQAEKVHFVPIVRGALRDAGRSTKKVEHFFQDETITAYRDTALSIITGQLEEKGFMVTDVIVRAVDLPEAITKAIEGKKEREQEVEKERAELERVALNAEQKVRQATADKNAAIEQAQAIKTLADAEAYKILKLQAQLAKSPNYVELVKAERWDGKVPQVSAGQGTGLLLNIGNGS